MKRFTGGLAAIALLAGLGLAGAQQPAGPAPETTGTAPLPEKSKDSAVLVDGKLTAPGAPADSQTVPSKFSERNAALDALPIMAFPLPLTDAQKQRIYDSVSGTNAAAGNVTAKPADLLPDGIEMRELPQQITNEIPAVRDLKYAKLGDKVLLVRAPNRIVVGEIGK